MGSSSSIRGAMPEVSMISSSVASGMLPASPPPARPGPATGTGDDPPAGPADHVGAADGAQAAADQPGAGTQADQPGRPHPPRERGLASASARNPAISAGLYGCLARSRGSAASCG